jgi:hemolysin activation/secretion protein
MLVREFRLEDIPYLKEAEVQEVLQPFTNKELTYAKIEEAINRVSELYREKGYPAVKVYLPPQDGTDGIIVLKALVGSYGSNSLQNNSLVTDWLVKGFIDANFPKGRPVKRQDLERMVLLIGDLPGAALPKLSMGAGSAPGTTDFFVEVPKGERFKGFFSSDNMGSYYTGRWRFMTGVDVLSPFNLGDKLSVFGLTTETQELNSLAFNYELPLNASGLRLNLGYSAVYYRLGQDYEDLEFTGRSKILEATLSYPIIRAANQNLYLSFNLAYKSMEERYGVFDFEQKDHATVGKFGLTYERWSTLFGKPLYTRFGGKLTYGNFRAADENEDTDGAFAYANLEFMASLALAEKWTLSLAASGQKAIDRPLDSVEQFSVTGANGVKAYRESISGDNGYVVNGEIRYRLPSIGVVDHYIGAFGDYGYWRREKRISGLLNSDSLADVGLSYYLNLPHFSLKTQLVHAVGPYPEEVRKDSETYLSVMAVVSF